jgi:3-oxoacyl-[acyl-carrier protein] reductase
MKVNLAGKVALITGATKGVGKNIALKLAENGADIAINARRPGPARELIQQIEAFGVKGIFEQADITDYQAVKKMVSQVLQQLGKIDILVVSGGATAELKPNFFAGIDPNDYLAYVKGQWLSRLYCARAVLDHMAERKTGKMIFLGTDGGRWPTPGESIAGGVGAALVMSTKVLAKEFARWQIRVNTICITVTKDTPGLDWALSDSPAAKIFQKALERQPFPVYSDDVAETVLFFASNESDQITGQILSVNGGLSFPG